MASSRQIELLAPAKNLECGKIAVNYGADAVYIGAPKFGARAAAGNSLEDIAELVRFAHFFNAKVYVALNTILYDSELEEVEQLIHQLYKRQVDAIIVQDMAILEMNLPPIAIHASTQTDNRDIQKVQFLENVGFERVILARELSLNEIREMKKQSAIELESFIHGALCVCYSGQCYMSFEACGRSANRGECAQFCRLPYTLKDADGRIIEKNKYLLSPKDLNLSNHLEELIDAGITSFKIEGRLKDADYIKNVVSFYRQALDDIMKKRTDIQKSSSGSIQINFIPNPQKSFQRGFTDYFIDGRKDNILSLYTPKSIGEFIGRVKAVDKRSFELDVKSDLQNGDGICFLTKDNDFAGVNVNVVDKQRIFPNRMDGITVGIEIYRNFDKAFMKILEQDRSQRKVKVGLNVVENESELIVQAKDEDNVSTQISIPKAADMAQNLERNIANIQKQLLKSGDSHFEFYFNSDKPFQVTGYYPISEINQIRRDITADLITKRLDGFSPKDKNISINHPKGIQNKIDYKFNISNRLAGKFYEKCGFEKGDKAFELKKKTGADLMTTKHCIKYALNACNKNNKTVTPLKEPLYLCSDNETYQLFFDCKICVMNIRLKK